MVDENSDPQRGLLQGVSDTLPLPYKDTNNENVWVAEHSTSKNIKIKVESFQYENYNVTVITTFPHRRTYEVTSSKNALILLWFSGNGWLDRRMYSPDVGAFIDCDKELYGSRCFIPLSSLELIVLTSQAGMLKQHHLKVVEESDWCTRYRGYSDGYILPIGDGTKVMFNSYTSDNCPTLKIEEIA